MNGSVDPSREQFDRFKALPRDVPVWMLNLICLNDRVRYPDGEEVSGAEAYRRYGRDSGPVFRRLGGQIVWRGRPEAVVIGPRDEDWDIAFIAYYPSAKAFMAMVADPDYKRAVLHRQLAVADSRLIRMGEAAEGEGFGG